MNIMSWILARMKEPSTIGVVAAAVGLVGFQLDEAVIGDILKGVAALLGVFAVASKEKGKG